MFNSLRNFLSDKLYPSFYSLGGRFHQIIGRKKKSYITGKPDQVKTADHYLMDSFVNVSKTLPPKFDSVADRLMAESTTTSNSSRHDQQQLFLQQTKRTTSESQIDEFKNKEIFDQLQQLNQLLRSIISDYSKTNSYNTSFLRELIHNIYQDLHVILSNLDIKIMLETDVTKKL